MMSFRLIEEYQFPEEQLERSLLRINKFLKREEDIQLVDFKVIESALSVFRYLPERFQKSVAEIRIIVFTTDLNALKSDPDRLADIMHLYLTFQENISKRDQLPMRRSPWDETSIRFTELMIASQSDPLLNKALAKHNENAKRVTRLLIELRNNYLLPQLLKIPDDRFQNLLQRALPKSDGAIEKIARSICLNDPRLIAKSEKAAILLLLRGINRFFSDYLQVSKKLKTEMPHLSELPLAEREILLIGRFAQVKNERGEPLPIPANLDPMVIEENFQNLLEEIYEKVQKAASLSATKTALLFASTVAVPRILDKLLSPFAICLIGERIFCTDMEWLGEMQEGPPLECFDASDVGFSASIGNLVESIGNSLIALGSPSGTARLVSSILKKILSAKKAWVGEQMQKGLNLICTSESILAPFILCEKLLFDIENEENWVPVWESSLSEKEMQKEAYSLEVTRKIQATIYSMIMAKIKEQSSLAHFGASNASSVQAFANTLIKELFQLLQQPMLMKLLVAYLLEEVKEAI